MSKLAKSPVRWLTDAQYASLPIGHRLAAWADSQVGVRESGSNKGRMVEEYQQVAGLGRGGGFAWCAAFVYWCCLKAGGVASRLPSRGQCAAVWRWAEWATQSGRRRSAPARGRLFYWVDKDRSGHIGVCLGDPVLGIFRTIEGNTNLLGSREGDGVYKRTRTVAGLKLKHQYGFIDLAGVDE